MSERLYAIKEVKRPLGFGLFSGGRVRCVSTVCGCRGFLGVR